MRVALALPLLLLVPAALADETLPACEPGQSPPGGRSTDLARPALSMLPAQACEGEHWDGQDPIERGAGSDPNGSEAEPARTTLAQNEAYASAAAPPAAIAAAYVGACAAGGPGLEGASACGGTAEVRVALYARDETPGDLVWTGLSFTRLVYGRAGDETCTYEEVNAPPAIGIPCARDNTAVSAAVLLP